MSAGMRGQKRNRRMRRESRARSRRWGVVPTARPLSAKTHARIVAGVRRFLNVSICADQVAVFPEQIVIVSIPREHST